MYSVERVAHDRVDVVVNGRLETEDMRQLIDTLEVRAADVEDGRMLIDVEDFHLPSLGAMKVEFANMPELMRLMRRFSHVAVLSDEGWVNAVSSLEGKLIPGLEINTFPRHQRYQAETWLGNVH
ncbi:MAG TPA: STAS/SEC14 domain-containing protein [Hyphomicrobiales bacterium]|nr:STAS/SEC14 domain-containing protein [Hyphomicrobiales bacterium]